MLPRRTQRNNTTQYTLKYKHQTSSTLTVVFRSNNRV